MLIFWGIYDSNKKSQKMFLNFKISLGKVENKLRTSEHNNDFQLLSKKKKIIKRLQNINWKNNFERKNEISSLV